MDYIKKNIEKYISKWLTIIEKEVRFPNSSTEETYYSVKVSDYVAAITVTKDEQILLVKQFRPVVEGYTYELPSGMIDPGENSEQAVMRELYEETGHLCGINEMVFLGELRYILE